MFFENYVPKIRDTVVTIGKFDGVHLGHSMLIDKANEYKKSGLSSVVFSLMADTYSAECIYTEYEKRQVLECKDIDMLISHEFDDSMKNMSPEAFIKDVLHDKLGVRAIVVGSDFRFGLNRAGDISTLQKYSGEYMYELVVCDKVSVEFEEKMVDVSSTLIKKAIAECKLDLAKKMLGRSVSISGKVIRGNQYGRTIGIPTTNILVPHGKLLPNDGVYISKIYIGKDIYSGISDIGRKPTIGSGYERTVETNIFDFDVDIYGKDITVTFEKFIREEKKFDDVEQLKQQMSIDIAYAHEII